MNTDTLKGAAALGAVAGLRSMMAPALLSQAVRTGSIELEGTQLEFLSTQLTADIATGAAVLELIADKLPFTPDRTSPGPLIARAASGALVGAALCAARKKELLPGILVGAFAAVAGAFAGYLVRRSLTQNLDAPDLLVALAEDAVAVGVGTVALRHQAI